MCHVAYMVEMRNAYKTLIRKPERKKLLVRAKYQWEDDMRMIL